MDDPYGLVRRLQETIRQYEETMRRATESPMKDYLAAIENASLSKAILEMGRLDSVPSLAAGIASITSDAVHRMSTNGVIDEMLRVAAERDLETSKLASTSLLQDSIFSASSAIQLMNTVDLASATLAGINWNEMGGLLDAGTRWQRELQFLTNELASSHAALIDKARLHDGGFTAFPDFVTRVPSENLFLHSRTLRVISPHEEEDQPEAIEKEKGIADDTDAVIEALLPKLDPAFVEMLRGADDPWLRKAPDWRRHSASSLREVLEGVFHRVAPSDEVKKIVTNPATECDKNGFPLPTVKIQWLCQYIGLPDHRRNAEAELLAILEVLRLAAKAVHSHSGKKFENEFVTIRRQARAGLRRMLLLWASRSN